jgi:hypothetical protein
METRIRVVLYGSLRQGPAAAPADEPLGLDLAQPQPLALVLERLGIPPAQVQLAMINHRAVAPDALVRPGDRLALFPREYPIFADWCAQRGGDPSA